MLKKIIATVCVIAMITAILSGCSFIYKNEQRDAEQPVAVVEYGGRVAYVTKGELATLFNQQGFMYISYYGWTAEKTFDQLLKSLSNNTLISLKAKDYLTNLPDVTLSNSTIGIDKPTVEQLIKEMEELLTDKEIMEAKIATNDIFREAFDEIVAEIEEEIRLANPVDEDEEEDADDEDEDNEDEEDEELPRPLPPKADEEVEIVIPDDFFTIIKAEIGNDSTPREALRRLNRAIEKQNRDYNYYYSNQLTSKVIERYREEFKKTIADPVEADIIARYNEMKAANLLAFAKDGAYKTALESNPKNVVYHPGYDIVEEKGYFYVKNILLKFSPEQEAELKKFKDQKVANEDAIIAFRAHLADQILVNVSNVDFDENEERSEDNPVFSRKDVPAATIIAEMQADLNAATTLAETIQVFIDWTYKVNDDPGMFNVLEEGKPDYLVPPAGLESPFVPEFTELSRALFELGEGAYGLGANELSYTVTDFGIHFILVTSIPFNYAEKKGGNNDIFELAVIDDMNFLTLDAVIDNMTGQTLREYIFDTLHNEKVDNALTVSNNAFFRQHEETAITKHPKVYKDILKKAQELEEN